MRFPTTLILTGFLAFASPALAAPEITFPTLFDVTGVVADDVLNIRAQPSAEAPIVGTLPPDATDIEVLQADGGWGQVNAGEQSGWVSLRFLAEQPGVWERGALPSSFRCVGTEPFWNVAADGDDLIMSTPETERDARPVHATMDTGIPADPTRAVQAEGMTLVATPDACSDGMSDRAFGLRALLILQGDNPQMLTGCCTVQP